METLSSLATISRRFDNSYQSSVGQDDTHCLFSIIQPFSIG